MAATCCTQRTHLVHWRAKSALSGHPAVRHCKGSVSPHSLHLDGGPLYGNIAYSIPKHRLWAARFAPRRKAGLSADICLSQTGGSAINKRPPAMDKQTA